MILMAAVVVMATASCGVKRPPLPPVIRVADPTRDLKVFQEDREAVLSWTYPSSTTSGEALPDLESVEVWRATMLEVEAPPPGEKPQERRLNRQLLEANGELIVVLDEELLHAVTRGSKLEWRDDLMAWWESHQADQPQMVWYAVRSVCCRGRESELSNIARLVPEAPPLPPTGLELETEAEGIRLTWVPHGELPVTVERSPDGELWQAVTPKPLTTGEWLDRGAAQGTGWNYRLRSVKRHGQGARTVGEPGEPVGVFYTDIYPTEAPADLVCLPESERVRLVWRAVAGADFYRVYRGVGGDPVTPLATEVRAGQYEDEAPPTGSLSYEVTAIDAAGNESPASSCTAARGGSP
jgi:hypothetical protein